MPDDQVCRTNEYIESQIMMYQQSRTKILCNGFPHLILYGEFEQLTVFDQNAFGPI